MPFGDYGVVDILGNVVILPRASSDSDPPPAPVQFHVVISPPCIHKYFPTTTAVEINEFQVSFRAS